MTKDLEETLAELGPDYARMVERMRAPFEREGKGAAGGTSEGRHWFRCGFLVAASLALALGLAAVFGPSGSQVDRKSAYPRCYTVALDVDPAAIRELVATQRPDGSWSNDFVTRQNAAALRGVKGAELAYRRAVRYLRVKGLAPLSDDELRTRSRMASGMLASIRGI